jgi:response regulator RpfG family c-di-GMP phosphodiesterase
MAGWENTMNCNTLLIVDDEQNILNSLKRELKNENYDIYTAGSAKEGLELLNALEVGVLLTDRMMPGMDGIAFLTTVRELYPDIVRLLLTGQATLKSAMDSINHSQIFSYLTKPWESDELKLTISRAFEHYNLLLENKRLQKLTHEQNEALTLMNANLENRVNERTRQLQESIREGIIMLATAAEARDDNTGDHIYRIRELTRKICKGMNLSPRETSDISFFSMMHDVGKIHIPDHILMKPGSLTDDEFNIMRTHAVIGEKILGNKPFYKTAREIARSHHEHWDGTGYPDGLKGEAIPLSARIVAIADVFDALTHDRHYKKAWAVSTAINDMTFLSGRQFDPEAMDVFLRIQSESAD